MKTLFIIGLLLTSIFVNAQDYKNLEVTFRSEIDKQQAIYLEPIDKDVVLAIEYLKSSMSANGFRIVAEKKDAVYVISINYNYRKDSGCGVKRVIKDLSGQIINIKNNADIISNFSFSQGSFEGKCKVDIMSALAKKLNTGTKK